MMTITDIPPADALDAATDLIEKHGRYRGRLEDAADTHCPVTAIVQVVGLGDTRILLYRAIEADVGRDEITGWNDTEPDDAVVLGAMRRVATQLREAS